MRCDSMLNGCRDRGIRRVAESLNGCAERAVQISPIAPCTFVQIDERNDQMHTVVSRCESPLGFRAGFIALSPSLHL
jgi:hypothetical protein